MRIHCDKNLLKVNGEVAPMLNQVPCHEAILGDVGIAPHILDLSTRRR